jgi:hypothetical protein
MCWHRMRWRRSRRLVAAAPELELVFSDEDQLREGRRASPYFKPGWNPDLLLEQNCINHLAAWRRDVVGGLGGMRGAYDGSQDYDFALRATADMPARKVRHIPMVLYHWRQSAGAASAASAEACRDAAWRAVRDYLGAEARVAANEAAPRWLAVRFSLTRPAPKVSLIGATPALLAATEYDPARLELVGSAAAATGEVLVFLAAGMRAGVAGLAACAGGAGDAAGDWRRGGAAGGGGWRRAACRLHA